jgi:predicted  nucleic acid-binding Zn-ribbon protein
MNIVDNFVKSYTDKSYRHTTTVSHKGKVIAFAMDDHRHIHYSILDLEQAGASNASALDVNFWPNNPKELHFPNEIARVGYAVLPNIQLPIFKKGTRTEAKPGTLRPEEVDPFLSTTARLTADAHFQVLSDGKFIYVFRQSIGVKHEDMLLSEKEQQNSMPLVNETLLLDRFVLSGSELESKMEVRYQRSRHKYNPQTNKDGLGAKDLEKRSFFEPTQELNFIKNLTQGRFTVLLLPTQIADLERWEIFSHNSKTDQIDSFNVERSKDGLFNTKGTQLYTSPDPQYQRSVLERQPGTDSFTGEPLIPLVSKSGYAEFALEFDGKNTSVELPQTPLDLFNQFTIEAWVYFNRFASYSRIIEFGNGCGADNIILANQATSNDLLFCFRGSVQHDLLVKDILESNQWIHLAVSLDRSGNTVLYKNGIIIGKTQFSLPPSVIRKRNYLGKGNWSDPLFDGKIDEIRIWQRARTQTEIQADLNHRLVGNEPGLYSYWRFDEGKGKQLCDQTDNVNHATIVGGTWVQSDAPIGDHPGIQRTSFCVQSAAESPTPRTIQSGLSALLYHQQEKAATGYDQQEKPVKRNARVMLTFATEEANRSEAEKPFIAALDFGISREGKLAQVPDQVALPKLQSDASAKQDLDAISRLQEEVTGLTASINQLEKEIALLMAAVPKISSLEAQKVQLEANIKSLTTELNTKQQDLFNYFFRIQRSGTSNYFQSDGNGGCSDQPLNTNEPGQLWRIFPGYQDTKKFCPANHLTTHTGGSGWFSSMYRGKERGLIHDGSLKVDDFWYQVAGMSQVNYVSGNVYECSIGRNFKQNWTLLKTDRALPVITDLESQIKNSKEQLVAVIVELEDLYRKNKQLKEKQSELALLKIKLDNKQTELELMQAGIQGEVARHMPWLHTDPFGLTVA